MAERAHDVAALADLPEGAVLEVECDGEPVLLIHDESGRIDAVGGRCPHAGAPLAKGIRFDGRIVCPWHKATFCTRTGAVLEPPAVDPLPRFDVRVEAGRILVAAVANVQKSLDPDDRRCFVIVGGGAAGAVAAQTLRQEGFGGRLVLLDRENRVPYDRTVLSKYFLSGEKGGEKSPLQTQAFYRRHRIERVTAEVVGLDPEAREIRCADGATFRYDAALLATGSVPRTLSLPGCELEGVFLLRSRADADAILARAERSLSAVILGTSFVGMEVAASLRERGLDVTVVGQEREPFETKLGAQIGAGLRTMHEERGVVFRLGREVACLEGSGRVGGVRLTDGELLRAELVVAGLGVEPAADGFEGLRLNPDKGLEVERTLRVAEGLYAAGDVASFPLWGDGPIIRVEHWRVAEQHGRIAALNMLGRSVPYDAPPVFWTIQYRKRLDYVGHATTWDEIVIHGDPGRQAFVAYYVKDGIVAAAAGMGRDDDTASLTELFRLRHDWTATELGAQPARTLASLRPTRR